MAFYVSDIGNGGYAAGGGFGDFGVSFDHFQCDILGGFGAGTDVAVGQVVVVGHATALLDAVGSFAEIDDLWTFINSLFDFLSGEANVPLCVGAKEIGRASCRERV